MRFSSSMQNRLASVNHKTLTTPITSNGTFTVNLSSLSDAGQITSSLAVTDMAGNQFNATGNPVTLPEGPEAPSLTAPTTLTVPAGGSVPLSITVAGVDSDDTLSVSISGVPSFEKVTAVGATPTITKHSNTYTYAFNTLPADDWNNGLILSSSYTGKSHPVNRLTVTAANTTAGETATSAAQTIKVTDPPISASSGLSNGSLSLSDLMSQFVGDSPSSNHSFAGTTIGSSSPTSGSVTSTIAGLIESHTASPSAALRAGAAGLVTDPLIASDQRAFLTHPSHA
jgi:hypothetical protein